MRQRNAVGLGERAPARVGRGGGEHGFASGGFRQGGVILYGIEAAGNPQVWAEFVAHPGGALAVLVVGFNRAAGD